MTIFRGQAVKLQVVIINLQFMELFLSESTTIIPFQWNSSVLIVGNPYISTYLMTPVAIFHGSIWATKKNASYFPLNPGWLIGILTFGILKSSIYWVPHNPRNTTYNNQGPFFHLRHWRFRFPPLPSELPKSDPELLGRAPLKSPPFTGTGRIMPVTLRILDPPMEGWTNLYDAEVFRSSKWRQAFEAPMILTLVSYNGVNFTPINGHKNWGSLGFSEGQWHWQKNVVCFLFKRLQGRAHRISIWTMRNSPNHLNVPSWNQHPKHLKIDGWTMKWPRLEWLSFRGAPVCFRECNG